MLFRKSTGRVATRTRTAPDETIMRGPSPRAALPRATRHPAASNPNHAPIRLDHDRGRRRTRFLRSHHDRHEHGRLVRRQSQLAVPRRLAPGKEMLRADLCRRATSDTTAPGAYDSATIRPLSSSLHRRRRPTPLRISTRPRGAVASTIWSTIYANRCRICEPMQSVRIFRTMPLAARWGELPLTLSLLSGGCPRFC